MLLGTGLLLHRARAGGLEKAECGAGQPGMMVAQARAGAVWLRPELAYGVDALMREPCQCLDM